MIHFVVNSVEETGTYFRFHNLAVGLTALGQRVTVFGVDPDPRGARREELRQGVSYRIVPSVRGQRFFGAPNHPVNAARRCLARYETCDVAHLFQPFLSAAAPWRLRLRRTARAHFYDWDDLWGSGGLLAQTDPRGLLGRWTRFCVSRLERALPRAAHGVTACSTFLAERATQLGARSVTLIHNGFWRREQLGAHAARQGIGLRLDSAYLGFMGRTDHELDWCFDTLHAGLANPRLRLAICGLSQARLPAFPDALRARVDYLGRLPPARAADFAKAIDLGLLPLADNPFNNSRFPIKFADYLAAGTPVLCSEIGECGRLANSLMGAIPAGRTRESWRSASASAVARLGRQALPRVDTDALEHALGWHALSSRLLEAYRQALARPCGC